MNGNSISPSEGSGTGWYGYLRNRIWALLTQIVEGGREPVLNGRLTHHAHHCHRRVDRDPSFWREGILMIDLALTYECSCRCRCRSPVETFGCLGVDCRDEGAAWCPCLYQGSCHWCRSRRSSRRRCRRGNNNAGCDDGSTNTHLPRRGEQIIGPTGKFWLILVFITFWYLFQFSSPFIYFFEFRQLPNSDWTSRGRVFKSFKHFLWCFKMAYIVTFTLNYRYIPIS